MCYLALKNFKIKHTDVLSFVSYIDLLILHAMLIACSAPVHSHGACTHTNSCLPAI